jgi:hypothetical protein
MKAKTRSDEADLLQAEAALYRAEGHRLLPLFPDKPSALVIHRPLRAGCVR